MTSPDADPVFLDTNILVYASVVRSPFHHVALGAVQSLYAGGVELWISRQVLREYLAVLTRPQTYANPHPVSVLISDVNYFQNRFHVAEENNQTTDNLLALMAQIPIGGKQIHDANIVAAMQAYGVKRILTGNVSDFSRFSKWIMVMPL